MQAEARVNTEQASKTDIAEADPSGFWGRPLPLDEIATALTETREALGGGGA
jgi:hypothetical protein